VTSGLKFSADKEIVDIPTGLKHDPILALSNGFLYPGNGVSLIKDCSVERLAATWKEKEKIVVFREELAESTKDMRMRFYIVKGAPGDGHAPANRLNTWPSYLLRVKDGAISATKVLPEMRVQ